MVSSGTFYEVMSAKLTACFCADFILYICNYMQALIKSHADQFSHFSLFFIFREKGASFFSFHMG